MNKLWEQLAQTNYSNNNNNDQLFKENERIIKKLKHLINYDINHINFKDIGSITTHMQNIIRMITFSDTFIELSGQLTPAGLVYLTLASKQIRDHFILQALDQLINKYNDHLVGKLFEKVKEDWEEYVQITDIRYHELYKVIQVGIREITEIIDQVNDINNNEHDADYNKEILNHQQLNNDQHNVLKIAYYIIRIRSAIIRSSKAIKTKNFRIAPYPMKRAMFKADQKEIILFRKQLSDQRIKQLYVIIQYIAYNINKYCNLNRGSILRKKWTITKVSWIIGHIRMEEINYPVDVNQPFYNIKRNYLINDDIRSPNFKIHNNNNNNNNDHHNNIYNPIKNNFNSWYYDQNYPENNEVNNENDHYQGQRGSSTDDDDIEEHDEYYDTSDRDHMYHDE